MLRKNAATLQNDSSAPLITSTDQCQFPSGDYDADTEEDIPPCDQNFLLGQLLMNLERPGSTFKTDIEAHGMAVERPLSIESWQVCDSLTPDANLAPNDQEKAEKLSNHGRAEAFSSHLLNLTHVCDYVPIPHTDVHDDNIP